MQPKKSGDQQSGFDLFRSRLDQILNRKHPLFVLAGQIDWDFFEREFGSLYVPNVGRPGLPIRLMVGLHYLKNAFDESDESVVDRFLENPYWQYFCGREYFEHELPLDATSLVKWRHRVGEEGMEKLLQETIETAKRGKLIKRVHLRRVNVDTTVQEKAIAFPTDARLYHKMRRVLVRSARERGIVLRQSYRRLGKRALQQQGRYSHARQSQRASRETRRLKVFLGRVMRDIDRKSTKKDEALKEMLSLASRLYHQKRHDKNKIYSVHATEVECISKGKVHKKYEFGCKVSAVSTSRDNWVVGIQALHGNPYDGHTLKEAIEQVESLVGWKPQEAFCDKGYRGTTRLFSDVKVYLPGRRKRKSSRSLRKWLKRRSAIEPIIGHLKHDHRMDRNYLKGKVGDKMNALLAGSGFNIRKLLRAFLSPILEWLFGMNIDQNRRSWFFPTLTMAAKT